MIEIVNKRPSRCAVYDLHDCVGTQPIVCLGVVVMAPRDTVVPSVSGEVSPILKAKTSKIFCDHYALVCVCVVIFEPPTVSAANYLPLPPLDS